MREQREINYLKAFAIILVVFYHVLFSSGVYQSSAFCLSLTAAIGNVHVPLFILLAGYLCHKQEIRTFYLKKIRKILIPFLFMSCLKLLFTNLVSAEHSHAENLGQQLYDAFVCGQLYWFCYCLLLLFLIAPLLWNHKGRIWILLILSAAVNICLRWNGIFTVNVLQIHAVIYQMPFFLTGMLLAQYRFPEHIKGNRRKGLLFTAAALVAAVTCVLRFICSLDRVYVIDVLMGVSFMVLLYGLALLIRGAAADRILTLPGRYSFQIMLIEGFYRTLLLMAAAKFINIRMPVVLLITLLTLVLSVLSSVILHKIPYLSFMFGLTKLSNIVKLK